MRILLAEDDKDLNRSLTFTLEAEGFIVDSCLNGEDALYYAKEQIHDIILLDRMMPYMEGTTVLKALRSDHIHIPVILITALGTLTDKISGLDMGADDYLVKPFAFEELLARIRCITRRPHKLSAGSGLHVADIQFLPEEGILKGPKGDCTLSKRESELIAIFIRNHNQILQRNTLLLKVWGPDSDVEDGNLDNYIHFLRKRLKSVNSRLTIKTVRGIGYSLHDSGTFVP